MAYNEWTTTSEGPAGNGGWQPYCEPLSTTLKRTIAIAIIVGAVLAWRFGGFAWWPFATVLVLWPSLGGHFVELGFLNHLRPKLPATRGVHVGARLIVWFLVGAVFTYAMAYTAMFFGARRGQWPHWWIGGLAFIGVELIAHAVLRMRGMPNFYNGRG